MNLQSVLNVMQYKQNNSKKNIFILKIESPRGLNANPTYNATSYVFRKNDHEPVLKSVKKTNH